MAADEQPVEQRVERLERELLTPAVRADRDRLEHLLHAEFEEVGAAGRRWRRDELIAELVAGPGGGDVEVGELAVDVISDGVVLVTYLARRPDRLTRRSSLWVRVGDHWVVRFHQGTPVEPSP